MVFNEDLGFLSFFFFFFHWLEKIVVLCYRVSVGNDGLVGIYGYQAFVRSVSRFEISHVLWY